MSKRVRLGVVGVRSIGKNHCKRSMTCPEAELVAVADTSQEMCELAKSELGIDRAYTSAEALFAQDDIDAVVLALPNPLHAPLTILALEAGKHVMVEKPIARFSSEANAMIRAREASGCILMVGMNQRFEPLMPAARHAITQGKIGKVQLIKARWSIRRTPRLWSRGDWSMNHEASGGGPLLDLGIHKLDQALYLTGFPQAVSVSGFTSRGVGHPLGQQVGKDYQVEDMAGGMVRLNNGGSIMLEAAYFQNSADEVEQSLEIYGTHGGFIKTSGQPARVYTVGDDGAIKDIPLSDPAGSASSTVEHFCRVVQGKEPLIPTAEQAAQGLAIVQGLYKSALKQHQIDLA